ncbi:hypothetical protein ACSSS7_004392 [Eimeria intestinalis]
MDEVEDLEDRAALRQTAKEQKTVQQEMSDDFRDDNVEGVDEVTSALNELPALATYCIRFLSDNKSDTLLMQIERFKEQLEGAVQEGEAESASAAQLESEENSESSVSAAWESEIEEEAEEEEDGGSAEKQ